MKVDQKLIEFLVDLGVDKVFHHQQRKFIDHLIGTFDLLAAWENPRSVCNAGLFHSIYGTQAFKKCVLSFGDRDSVRGLIGERAERLAYWFCVMDREAFIRFLGGRALKNIRTGTFISIGIEDERNLAEIFLANRIDQVNHVNIRDGDVPVFQKLFLKLKPFLSTQAYGWCQGRLQAFTSVLKIQRSL